MVRDKIAALQELQAEKHRREAEATARAYANTVASHGHIPRIIIESDDQRERLVAGLDGAEHWIERTIVTPPPTIEPPGAMLSGNPQMRDVTPPKSYADDNMRRAEAITAASPPPTTPRDPGPNAVLCMT